MKRPSILNEKGELSENVKGIIYDRDKNIVGVVLSKDEWSFIMFLGLTSFFIAFNKVTGEMEFGKEDFINDPKVILEKVVKSGKLN